MKNQISKALMLQAIKDPGALYSSPEDVVNDSRLEFVHKKAILTSWYADAEALLRAEDENMTSVSKATGKASKLIESIKKAEMQLGQAA